MQTMSEYNRWLNGYGFWRGQYTVRNPEYIAGRNELKKLSDDFLQMGHVSYQRWMYLEWGAAIGKTEPPQNAKWDFLPEQLEIVIEYRRKKAQLRVLFPYGQGISHIPMSQVFTLLGQGKFPPDGSVYLDSSSGVGMFGINASHIINNPRPDVIHGALSDTVQVVSENEFHLTLKIEYNAELYGVLDKVRYFIEAARHKEEFDAIHKLYADALDDWRSGKPLDDAPLPQLSKIGSNFELLQKSKSELERGAKAVAYRVTKEGDATRACGLWLYDYKLEHGCNISEAYSILHNQEYAAPFHKKISSIEPDKVHRHAKACIEKADVLTTSRK